MLATKRKKTKRAARASANCEDPVGRSLQWKRRQRSGGIFSSKPMMRVDVLGDEDARVVRSRESKGDELGRTQSIGAFVVCAVHLFSFRYTHSRQGCLAASMLSALLSQGARCGGCTTTTPTPQPTRHAPWVNSVWRAARTLRTSVHTVSR
jgi:hypothetical protein